MALKEFGAILSAKDNFSDVINKAGRNIGAFAERTDKSMLLVAGAIAGVGALVTKFGADSVKKFMSFEKEMLNVKAITGATEEEFKSLSDMAKKMGETTSFTAQESAQALKYMATAGFNTEQSIAGLPSLLQLASASATDLGATADIVTDNLSAFGLMSKDTEVLAKNTQIFADVVAKASKSGNVNILTLGESFKYVASSSTAMGYSMQNTTALLTVLGDAGLKGSIGGTSLNSMFNDMSKKAKNGSISINKVKVSVQNADGTFRNMQDVMEDVNKATSNLTVVQKKQALSSIFGVEAMKGVNIVMAKGKVEIDKLEDSLNKSGGTAEKMANTQLGGLSGAMTLLSSSADGILLSVGEQLAPTLIEFTKILQDNKETISAVAVAITTLVVDGFNILVSTVNILTPIVAGLTAGFVAYKLTMFGLNVAVLGFNGAMGTLKIMTMVMTAKQWLLNIAMNANPLGLLVGIIAGVVVAGVLLYKNWDVIKEKAMALWESLTKVWDAMKNIFSSKKGTIEVEVKKTTSEDDGAIPVDGTHKNGLSNVPRDGYIAELHKGERVLTAEENKGGMGSNISVGNITVNSSSQDPKAVAKEVLAEIMNNLIPRLQGTRGIA
ncbi:MAG: phage tail tape measure protein [Cetobacterium sp.]